MSVKVTATWTEAPPQITLQWDEDPAARSYVISRKPLGAPDWNEVAGLPASARSWSDVNVQTGVVYEYQIRKDTGIPQLGYGYLCAAIRGPFIDSRGKIIVLVEKSLASPLAFSLARFQQDLVGDGWNVIRHDVGAADSVVSVKDLIRADYMADPVNTKSVLLFGHIPVPYSGFIAPDGHDDHRGAWPADVYYGEFDGQWTDDTVIATNVAHPKNSNVPGDGKFDQSFPPGPVRLQIGRVDLSELTCYANKPSPRYEVDLARQYLNKDHAFRHNQLNVPRRALLYYKWGWAEDEPAIATAFRNFPGFFGDQITAVGPYEYIPVLNANPYLWSYVVSSGSMYGCTEAASSDEFALNDPKAIFTSFMGSYFGDWDRESGFLRAVLGATTHTLTTMYGGQPQWILHPMGLGGTIGEAARLTQNNQANGLYPPHLNFGVGEVHIALLGDPTLRLHPVSPPSGLAGSTGPNGFVLNWNASSDTGVQGYHVYRATSPNGPFERITGDVPVTGTVIWDTWGTPDHFYMVRAIKLEETPSGSYYNASQGIFFPDPLTTDVPLQVTKPFVTQILPGAITLTWSEKSASSKTFEIERRTLPETTFQNIATLNGTEDAFIDQTISPGIHYYRVKAIGFAQNVTYSEETLLNLQTPFASSAGADIARGGDWQNEYGQDGYLIVNAATNLPPYLTLIPNGHDAHTFVPIASDWGALKRPNGSSGIFSQWVGPLPAQQMQIRFNDSTPRRVSLYMFDSSNLRTGRVDVVDTFSNTVLSSYPYNNLTNGNYYHFDIQNYATIRIISKFPTVLPILNGIFISTPNLPAPTIYPLSTSFYSSTNVSMRAVAGAKIHYTTDNTDPTEQSPLYTDPFPITADTTFKARAYLNGSPPSAVAKLTLTNSFVTSATEFYTDTVTRGDWQKLYGQSAWWIVGGPEYAGTNAEISFLNANTYIWSDSTLEDRALNRYGRGTEARLASCWYAETNFTVTLNVPSEQPQMVAMYFLDWDRSNRIQDIIFADSLGVELSRQRIQDFGDGKYLTFIARGALRVTFERVAGPNVALSGLFLSAAPPPPPPPPPPPVSNAPAQLTSFMANGTITIRIRGEPGQTFNIEHTSNFQIWTLQSRRTLGSEAELWSTSIPDGEGYRFYRATLVPP